MPQQMKDLTMFLLRTVASLAVCGAALWCANSVVAQQVEATEAEKALAAQIKCEDFKRTADGGWVSGPNARVGGMVFSNNTISGPGGINIGGADLVVVLNRKCGSKPI
jgi:hypothetical protein